MALATVTIGGTEYTVYASVAEADLYLDAAFHAGNWQDQVLTPDETKARALVTATRILDRQNWKGSKTVAAQTLAFPREDMGLTPEPIVDANDIPVDIVNASIEMANSLVDGSEVQTRQTNEDLVRSLTAGSVSITFARESGASAIRFPLIVHELVRKYLAGTSSSLRATATGVDGETIYPLDLGFSGGL